LLVLFKALLLQQWYGLSDPGLEEAVADRLSFRRFLGLSLSEPVPDHSTLWRFREQLGKSGLAEHAFASIVGQIERSGFVLKRGTLIDASLIRSAVNAPEPPAAPPALDGEDRPASKLVGSPHDPEAAWTKKEGRYFFGYKMHVGMDADSRIVRRLAFTPANINESVAADALICGDEAIVYADAHRRAPIESLFALLKNVYGFARARYRGLKRNAAALLLAVTAMNLKRWATS